MSTATKLSSLVQTAFVTAAVLLVAFYRQSPAFGTLSITFVSIFLEALPFMLLGALIGGFIEVFVSKDTLTRRLPKRTWVSIPIAAAIGFVFPVCECAIVPVVRRLLLKGLPLGAGIAFLLGAPIVNPLVAASTAVAYGYDWSIAAQRIVLGYVIAVVIGFTVGMLFDRRSALIIDGPEQPVDHATRLHPPTGPAQKILLAFRHAAYDFIDIGRFLVLGAFVAGLMQTLLARGELGAVAGSPVTSIVLMMLLAMALNLCSEADAFVAASFRTTFALSAQMAFMVLGPMLDIKLILMYFRLFRKRLIIALAGMTFTAVLAAMLVLSWSQ